MYKLIAMDLDGTLLDSCKEVSDENIKTIKEVIKKGVKLVVCSGRIYSGAKYYAKMIGTVEPVIACNGAMIRNILTEELIYSSTLSYEDCHRIIDICHEQDIYLHIYIGNVTYSERLEFTTLMYSNKNAELAEEDRFDIRVVDNLSHVVNSDNGLPYKIVVISEDTEKLKITRSLVEKIAGIDVTSSNYDNFEVINKGVNKGAALKFFSDRLGIRREEIMVIGDNENDIDMFKYAGFSVAMGNAEESVKRIADFVTKDNDDDGVAFALRKFVL